MKTIEFIEIKQILEHMLNNNELTTTYLKHINIKERLQITLKMIIMMMMMTMIIILTMKTRKYTK